MHFTQRTRRFCRGDAKTRSMLGANAFHAENTEKDKQSPQRKAHILRAVASSRETKNRLSEEWRRRSSSSPQRRSRASRSNATATRRPKESQKVLAISPGYLHAARGRGDAPHRLPPACRLRALRVRAPSASVVQNQIRIRPPFSFPLFPPENHLPSSDLCASGSLLFNCTLFRRARRPGLWLW